MIKRGRQSKAASWFLSWKIGRFLTKRPPSVKDLSFATTNLGSISIGLLCKPRKICCQRKHSSRRLLTKILADQDIYFRFMPWWMGQSWANNPPCRRLASREWFGVWNIYGKQSNMGRSYGYGWSKPNCKHHKMYMWSDTLFTKTAWRGCWLHIVLFTTS